MYDIFGSKSRKCRQQINHLFISSTSLTHVV